MVHHINYLDSTPTVSASSAYTAGDAVGGKISLTLAVLPGTRSAMIHQVIVTDLGAQTDDTDVIFFDSDPSATTFTDNAALDIADADLVKVFAVVPLTLHKDFSDNGVSLPAVGDNLNIPFVLDAGETTLYAALVTRGTPTYASTSDITLRVGIVQATPR